MVVLPPCKSPLYYGEDQEIRGFSVIECITKNSVISLFCPPTSLKLLYLCFVIDYGVADENLKDSSDHYIVFAEAYLSVILYLTASIFCAGRNIHVIPTTSCWQKVNISRGVSICSVLVPCNIALAASLVSHLCHHKGSFYDLWQGNTICLYLEVL